jgi:hypothetical protein
MVHKTKKNITFISLAHKFPSYLCDLCHFCDNSSSTTHATRTIYEKIMPATYR